MINIDVERLDINYLINDERVLTNIINKPVLKIFDDSVIDFLDSLSKKILNEGKEYTDLISFGFWIRKSNILNIYKKYSTSNRLGRGIIFHIAPSNVPLNFAYSLVCGLLSGNTNIVKISSKEFSQVLLLIKLMKETLCFFPEINLKIFIIQYKNQKEVTDYFSSIANVRIIWGGDKTISNIRKSELPSYGKEICFFDRYSFLLINAEDYLEEKNKKLIANRFYNDTYLNDQNACTSPKLLVWYFDDEKILENAKKIFWNELHLLVKEKYEIQPIQIMDKLVKEYIIFSEGIDGFSENIYSNSLMTIIDIKELNSDILKMNYNSGFFLQYETKKINDIISLCQRKTQTLATYGFDNEEVRKMLMENGVWGIDRVVKLGETLNFDVLWDGYDLILELSREIG
ncbi:MAG: acyl-CoA reductase [Lachnospirales bacterium]